MPARQKLTLFLIAIMAIFLFYPKEVLADVLLNELLPNPSSPPDWVELYNNGDEAANPEGWSLIDSTSEILTIHEATISAHSFLVVEVSNRLNKNEDTVYLRNPEGEEIDSYSYNYNPGTDISFGRMPDGGEWGVCSELTPESENNCILPSPTLPPVSSPSPSPSPTSSSPQPEASFLEETPSPKPVKITGATLLGKILGEEGTSLAGFFPWEATEESKSQEATRAPKAKFISKLFLGLGLVFLAVAGIYLWYNLTKGRIIQG